MESDQSPLACHASALPLSYTPLATLTGVAPAPSSLTGWRTTVVLQGHVSDRGDHKYVQSRRWRCLAANGGLCRWCQPPDLHQPRCRELRARDSNPDNTG